MFDHSAPDDPCIEGRRKMQRRRPRSIALAALLALAAGVASAATIYRWTDAEGKIHYGEVVPERYRSQAKPISQPAPPTPEQQRQSLDRARQQKAQADSIRPAQAAASAPQTTPPVQAKASQKRPAQAPTPDTDCETWQRLYEESLDCFAPFRTVRGSTRPEAFEVCTPVEEPPPGRCRQLIR